MATPNQPDDAATPAPEPRTTEAFVREELTAAQQAYTRTKLYGTIIFLLLAIETVAVAAKFAMALQPHEAAQIASGFVSQQLDDHSDAIKESLTQRIPQMIEQSPDYVIQELPSCRETLESNVGKSLTNYTQSTSSALGTQMDTYLADNKDAIQQVLNNGSDPSKVNALGPGIRKTLEAYLADKPSDGESVQEQIDQSLKMLQDVKGKMDHLAKDSSLTATDKQTKHALAVIASSVTKENLQPIPLKEAIPQPTEALASAETTASVPAAAPGAHSAPPTPSTAAKAAGH